MGTKSGISNRGYHPAIHAMHMSMALRERLEQDAIDNLRDHQRMLMQAPQPPQGHAWHSLNAATRQLESAWRAEPTLAGRSQKHALISDAKNLADRVLREWNISFNHKLEEIRDYMGDEDWGVFFGHLPNDESAFWIVDSKVSDIQKNNRNSGEFSFIGDRIDQIEESLLIAEKIGPAFYNSVKDALFSELIELGDLLQVYNLPAE